MLKLVAAGDVDGAVSVMKGWRDRKDLGEELRAKIRKFNKKLDIKVQEKKAEQAKAGESSSSDDDEEEEEDVVIEPAPKKRKLTSLAAAAAAAEAAAAAAEAADEESADEKRKTLEPKTPPPKSKTPKRQFSIQGNRNAVKLLLQTLDCHYAVNLKNPKIQVKLPELEAVGSGGGVKDYAEMLAEIRALPTTVDPRAAHSRMVDANNEWVKALDTGNEKKIESAFEKKRRTEADFMAAKSGKTESRATRREKDLAKLQFIYDELILGPDEDAYPVAPKTPKKK
jgi:hypothetical protein